MTSVGVCRLCGVYKTLRKSHIIPEFIYQPMYDGKHRFFLMRPNDERSVKPLQKGLAERMLCHGCEQMLSRFERYASDVMTGNSYITISQTHDQVRISGLDYALFKLFLLSILWRASVSSLEFFKLVSLGPHEEKIRNMIIEERPGRPEEYGCIVTFSGLNGEDISDTMFNPEPFRWAGRRFCKFFFAGANWCFYCDSQPPTPHLRRLFLQSDGTYQGLKLDLEDAKYLASSAKAFARQHGYV